MLRSSSRVIRRALPMRTVFVMVEREDERLCVGGRRSLTMDRQFGGVSDGETASVKNQAAAAREELSHELSMITLCIYCIVLRTVAKF